MALDIDERHLLRLGHGEEELETEKDFSRWANGSVKKDFLFSFYFFYYIKEEESNEYSNLILKGSNVTY